MLKKQKFPVINYHRNFFSILCSTKAPGNIYQLRMLSPTKGFSCRLHKSASQPQGESRYVGSVYPFICHCQLTSAPIPHLIQRLSDFAFCFLQVLRGLGQSLQTGRGDQSRGRGAASAVEEGPSWRRGRRGRRGDTTGGQRGRGGQRQQQQGRFLFNIEEWIVLHESKIH